MEANAVFNSGVAFFLFRKIYSFRFQTPNLYLEEEINELIKHAQTLILILPSVLSQRNSLIQIWMGL